MTTCISFFTEAGNYKIHLIQLIDKEVRTSDYSAFIKTVKDVEKLKSISFINLWDLFGERKILYKSENEEFQAIIELIQEEIVNQMRFTI